MSFIFALRLPGQGWPLVGAARPQVPLVSPEAVAWQARGARGGAQTAHCGALRSSHF